VTASPVLLVGGRGDGLVVNVDPGRRVYTHIVEVGPKTYPAGTWAGPDSPEMVTTLVDLDTYVRVDAGTFEIVGGAS
jgi:hypothetical protein